MQTKWVLASSAVPCSSVHCFEAHLGWGFSSQVVASLLRLLRETRSHCGPDRRERLSEERNSQERVGGGAGRVRRGIGDARLTMELSLPSSIPSLVLTTRQFGPWQAVLKWSEKAGHSDRQGAIDGGWSDPYRSAGRIL